MTKQFNGKKSGGFSPRTNGGAGRSGGRSSGLQNRPHIVSAVDKRKIPGRIVSFRATLLCPAG